MAQRLVRAKRKIRDARIPYEVPDAGADARAPRLGAGELYLIFNEGYMAIGRRPLIRGRAVRRSDPPGAACCGP